MRRDVFRLLLRICFESFLLKYPLIAFAFDLLYNSEESCEQNGLPEEIGHEI